MHRNLKLLYWFNFFSDFRLFAPIAIIYFSNVTHSYALGMSIFSAAMLAAALFEMPTGIYSDMIGRKWTVVLGAVASIFSVAFYAVGLSFWFLLIGAILEGLARAFFSGNNSALIYESLIEMDQRHDYPNYSGKISSMYQLGLGFAAVLGGFIAQYSFAITLWLSVISQIVCFLISLFLTEPKVEKTLSSNIYEHLSESIKQFRMNKKLRLISITTILSYGVGESMWLFRSAFLKLFLPVWALGIAQAISNMGATLSFYFSGKLIKKFSEIKLLVIGTIYGRITDLIALIFPSPVTIGIMTSSSLFFGVSQTSEGSLLQKEFIPHQRATMGSLNSLGESLLFGIYSVLLGKVADLVGPINALIFSNLLLLPLILIYRQIYKSHIN